MVLYRCMKERHGVQSTVVLGGSHPTFLQPASLQTRHGPQGVHLRQDIVTRWNLMSGAACSGTDRRTW
jgi:hypothetical protein